jgi:hypothetical protein
MAKSEDPPITIAQQYFAAWKSADWEQCARLVHPESLSKIRMSSDKFVASLLVVDKYGGNLHANHY